MGEDLIENKIYVAELFGSDLQGNDLYKLEPLKQIGNATFVKVVPEFKEGDFVYEAGRIMIVKSYPSNYHANIWHIFSDKPYYNRSCGVNFSEPTFRYATEDEKQLLIDALKKDGKRWNAEKKRIEDIPKHKFKSGDKVRIKDGILSKTHKGVSPSFNSAMDKFIGKELTVEEYTNDGFVVLFEDYIKFHFRENWLEPWSDEPKKGDLAIFWDNGYGDDATIRLYDKKGLSCHYDSYGSYWDNAIKFESKEQFEKVLRGEI